MMSKVFWWIDPSITVNPSDFGWKARLPDADKITDFMDYLFSSVYFQAVSLHLKSVSWK